MGIQLAPRISFQQTYDTIWGLSYVCFSLFCKPILCFVFELWYSCCFNVKCWFHTFTKWCSHIPMWILILLDHRDGHVNSFLPMCFSLGGSDHFQRPQDQLIVFSTLFVSSVPSCLLFSRPPTLFLQGLRFLYQVSILLMWSPFFFNQFSYPVALMKMLYKFIILHSFLLLWIQFKLSALIILFSLFQMFSHVGEPP